MNSKEAFEQAKKWIPGGVNSPVRAWKSVGGTPFFASRGEGPYLFDIEGNRYIDLILAWGPLILGHADEDVINAVIETAKKGTAFGVPTILETELAMEVVNALESIEKVRMVNSGTEAVMSAIRLVRAATKRDKIVKFSGNYHGHSDMLLVKAGSGAATFGHPNSAGVTGSATKDTIVLPYNDIEAVKAVFKDVGNEIAGVVVEPVAGNMGVIPPVEGFLETLREETRKYGALLIFDEVMTGFRVAYGGAQSIFGIKPDVTTLGKVIGGGLPVGAYGASSELMSLVAPDGPMYQAGTLSGNPLAMSAGLTALRKLKKGNVYKELEERTEQLVEGLKDAAKRAGCTVTINYVPAMFTVFFHPGPVTHLEDVNNSDHEAFKRFFHAMNKRGVSLPPSPYEAAFLSTKHTPEVIEEIVSKAYEAFKEVVNGN